MTTARERTTREQLAAKSFTEMGHGNVTRIVRLADALAYGADERAAAQVEIEQLRNGHGVIICDCHTWPDVPEMHAYVVALEQRVSEQVINRTITDGYLAENNQLRRRDNAFRERIAQLESALVSERTAGVIEGLVLATKANCPGCAGKWLNVHPAERQHQLWVHRFVEVKSGRGRKWEGCMSSDIHDAIQEVRAEQGEPDAVSSK